MLAPRFLFLLLGATGWAAGPTVWVTGSLARIKQTERAGTNTQFHLSAAKGEYESLQVVIHAPAAENLTNTTVTVSDLLTKNGARITSDHFALYREHYVRVGSASPDWRQSNRPLGPGLYPDALIPFIDPATGNPPRAGALPSSRFGVPAGTNQPVWVDLFVPRESQAGEYAGTFSVTSDQGVTHGEIQLHVWDFALPVKPSLRSAFMIWQQDELPIARTLLKNKISPFSKSPEVARKLKSEGLSIIGLPFWSGADVSHCALEPAPSVAAVRAAIARMPPDLDLIDYSADEVGNCSNLYASLRQWGSVLHEAGVKNLVTMAPTAELLEDGRGKGRSAVDIWAVLATGYVAKLDAIKQAMAKGDSVWSYTTLVQDPYSPKWEIDFAPINFRIQPGFLSQSLGLTGILYWRVDLWTSDPWATADTTGQFNSNNYPGEGMLVYPGAPAGVRGVVPSMRLKWIRDGVEDYEYVALLKQLGYGQWAKEVIAGVGADWSHWTQDPAALETAREQLGQKLDSVAAGQKPSRH